MLTRLVRNAGQDTGVAPRVGSLYSWYVLGVLFRDVEHDRRNAAGIAIAVVRRSADRSG
jgi:hypothetical protein